MFGHHLAPFWLQFSSLFAKSSSNSVICSAFWILQILWSYYYLRGFGRNPYWAKALQNLACRIQAEISAGFCMHNFERNIRRILYAEFRAKSPHNAACRNSAETSADLRPKSPHNSVADFRQKSLQTADLYMQSVLQNLGLWLKSLSACARNICRTMHTEFRRTSPHNAACTSNSAVFLFCEVCIHKFSRNLYTILNAQFW